MMKASSSPHWHTAVRLTLSNQKLIKEVLSFGAMPLFLYSSNENLRKGTDFAEILHFSKKSNEN